MAEKQVAVRLTARIDQYRKAMTQAKQSTDDVASSGGRIQQLGPKFTQVGSTLSTRLTLPIVALGGVATKMAGDFDRSMTKIQTLVGVSADEVDTMRSSVMELAGATAKSPQELADALFVVTSAGLRGADAMDALEFAAKASAVGMGETETIARAVAGAMNAYGPSVLDASMATDILVATARAGNFEASQLAGSLGRVLPFAKQAQVGLEDVGGAIALITRTNGNASEAVTQLTGLIRAFVTPTQEGKAALEGLGLTAGDVRDHLGEHGLAATLQMLDGELGGNREALARIIGSAEGTSAAFQILDADAATLQGTFGETADAQGILGDAFAQTADSDAFKMQEAIAGVQRALVEIGGIILPVAADIAGGIAGVVSAFSGLPDSAQIAIVAALGVAAALGPVMTVIGNLIRAWGAMKTAMLAASASNPILLGLTAAAATAAIAIGIFGSSARNAKIEVDDLKDSVTEVQDPLKLLADHVADTASSNDMLLAVMAEAGITAGEYGEALAGVGELVAETGLSTRQLRGGFDDLTASQQATLIASGDIRNALQDAGRAMGLNEDELHSLLDAHAAFEGNAAGTIEKMENLAAVTDTDTTATDDLTVSTEDLMSANEELAGIVDELTASADESTASAKEQKASFDGVEAAARRLDDAISELGAELDRLIGSTIDLQREEDNWIGKLAEIETAIAAVDEDTGELTYTLDANTEAGRQNREAVRQAAEQILSMSDAMLENGASAGEATDRMMDMREELIEQMMPAFDGSRSRAESYIDALGLTPKSIGTAVELSGVEAATMSLAQLTADRVVKIRARYMGNSGVRIPGNAFDRGGYAPAGGLVAERRPEFVGGALVSVPTIVASPVQVTSGATTEAKFDRMLDALSAMSGQRDSTGGPLIGQFNSYTDTDPAKVARMITMALAVA